MNNFFRKFFFLLATDQRKGILANIIKIFLWFLSLVYGVGISFILFCYRVGWLKKHRLPRPVISIGNLTWGGVGKTPFVLWLAKELKAKNLKPVILTRGYMVKTENNNHPSDEAKMIEEVLRDVPVVVGKNRIAGAHEFLKNNEVDVFILDDGFQHWGLARDLDVVLIDATNPFGNGQLIPRGILREPVESLKRTDIVCLTKTDLAKDKIVFLKNSLKKISSKLSIGETVHKGERLKDIFSSAIYEPSILNNRKIAYLCGIGDPSSFESILEKLGAQIAKKFLFMDHHIYAREEVGKVVEECLKENIQTIVTTDKDAVKIAFFQKLIDKKITVLSLQIDISFIQGKDEFLDRVYHLVHS